MSASGWYNRSGNKIYSDKFGNRVFLSLETEAHIKETHPEVPYDEEIDETLSTPDLLVKSSKHPRSVEYYRLKPGNWHKVVVKKAEDGLFISTSHYASGLSRGEWLWRNLGYEPTQKELERNSGPEPPNDFPLIWPDDIALE